MEKQIHPSIAKFSKYKEVVMNYYIHLCFPFPPTENNREVMDYFVRLCSPFPPTEGGWIRKAQELHQEFVKVYDAYQTELNLPYDSKWDFSYGRLANDPEGPGGLLRIIREVGDGFDKLRNRAEIRLEEEQAPPQPGQGEATGTGGDERQKRNIITIKIEKMDVGLTQTEALCLMALKEELKNRTKYIRPVYITMRVWPDETLKGKNRLKYYWSNLRKKLDAKVKLPGFEHFLSRHEGYCLGTKNTPWKPPSWFKNIRFPKNLRLPLVVRPNR